MTGWNLPPGCTYADIERAYGGDGPCAVCGQPVDACLCPCCPVCDSIGDPTCYDEHGLVRSQEQIDAKAAMDDARAVEDAAEQDWADAEFLFDSFGFDSGTVKAMSTIERDCWISLGQAMPDDLAYGSGWVYR